MQLGRRDATRDLQADLRERARVTRASATRTLRFGVLCIGAGLILALSFPRPAWSAGAWIALAPLIVVALHERPRAALRWGGIAGIIFFLVLLRWIEFTFRVYSAIPWPLTWLPALLLAAYCALYIGVFTATISLIGHRRGPTLALLTAPFVWVATEWARGVVMGGFPWGSLGYSQSGQLTVIQIAEFGGVHAVSFVVLAVNAAIAGFTVLPRRLAGAGSAAAGLLLLSTLTFGMWRLAATPAEDDIAISIVQPSIEQPLKWDQRHTAQTLSIYGDLTRRVTHSRPDLIVWPETASPTFLRQDRELLRAIQDLSRTSSIPLLIGSMDPDGEGRLRNTAFLVTERGIVGRYDKMHLVPFGEYIPLASALGFIKQWAEFVSELEPGTRPEVFIGPPAPFAAVICYEGIFPGLVRSFITRGARLVINLSNDAWFGRTSGPLQHLAMYPFRAVEHRVAVVRAANTGISAFISPAGQIVQSMGLFERGVLTGHVPLRKQTTVYSRFGDWFAYVGLLVSGVGIAASVLSPRRGPGRAKAA